MKRCSGWWCWFSTMVTTIGDERDGEYEYFKESVHSDGAWVRGFGG